MSTSAGQKTEAQAGKESTEPSYNPWEKPVIKPVSPAAGSPARSKDGSPTFNPWEKPLNPRRSEGVVQQAPNPNISKAEQEMAQAVKLTPSELNRENAPYWVESNIAEITKEISNTKDPKKRAILEEELKALKQKRK